MQLKFSRLDPPLRRYKARVEGRDYRVQGKGERVNFFIHFSAY